MLQADQALEACQPDLRGWEWHCLRRLRHEPPRRLTGHAKVVTSLAYSPDGRLDRHGQRRRDGEALGRDDRGADPDARRGTPDWSTAVAFSPDGTRLASASHGSGMGRSGSRTWRPGRELRTS